MREIENCHWANSTVIIDAGWIQDWWVKNWVKTGYLQHIRVSPSGCSLCYRWKNRKLTVEKSWRYHFHEVIKVNISSNKTLASCMPWYPLHWKGPNIIFVPFLPKICNLKSNHNIHKITNFVFRIFFFFFFCKSVKVMKCKGSLRTVLGCRRLRSHDNSVQWGIRGF